MLLVLLDAQLGTQFRDIDLLDLKPPWIISGAGMLRLQHPHPCGGGGGAELCTDPRYRIDPLTFNQRGERSRSTTRPTLVLQMAPQIWFWKENLILLSKSELFGVTKWVAVNSYVADFLSLRCETHPEF